jgi:hypothetical protein
MVEMSRPLKKKIGRPRKVISAAAESSSSLPSNQIAESSSVATLPLPEVLPPLGWFRSTEPQQGREAQTQDSGEGSGSGDGPGVLSDEQEGKLRDILGSDGAGDSPLPMDGEAGGEFDGEDISGMLASISFETEDIQEVLEGAFESLAEWTKFDGWRLSERQARMMGKPLTQMANHFWGQLCAWIPDKIMAWMDSVPGFSGFLLASGVVLTPKFLKWRAARHELAGIEGAANMRGGGAPGPVVNGSGAARSAGTVPGTGVPMTAGWVGKQ